MRVFRLNAVGKDGRPLILGTADTARTALVQLRAALGDFHRAWLRTSRTKTLVWPICCVSPTMNNKTPNSKSIRVGSASAVAPPLSASGGKQT